MCGIVGYYETKKQKKTRSLDAALSAMRHRGPDGSGTWTSNRVGLGHTRLAIVDPDLRSAQPMTRGNYTVTFNGEIYNYQELREELGASSFTTSSDTEVLLRAYVKWGTDVVHHLHGMFAFAIYDKTKDELFCARDAVGQKPFVYTVNGEGFFFASELPALVTLIDKPKINVTALKLFLLPNFSHIPAPFTIYEGVFKLQPGFYMTIRNGNIVEEVQWYTIAKSSESKEIVHQACTQMIPQDVTSGVLLSGGIDSAIVKDIVGSSGYTMQFMENDLDAKRAQVVDATTKIVLFKKETFLDEAKQLVLQVGEPYFHTTAVYAKQLLAEVAKEHKVAFTGVGADEVFSGYNNKELLAASVLLSYNDVYPEKWLKKVVPAPYHFAIGTNLKTFKSTYYVHNFKLKSDLFAQEYRNTDDVKQVGEQLTDWLFSFAAPQNFVDLSYKYGLFIENQYATTMHGDVAGMANSVEVRAPFLDTRVVEYGFSLPLTKKINWLSPGQGKKLLREIASKMYGVEFAHAKKIGFGVHTDVFEWDLNDRNIIANALHHCNRSGYFNSEEVLNIFMTPQRCKDEFVVLIKLCCIGWFLEEHHAKNVA